MHTRSVQSDSNRRRGEWWLSEGLAWGGGKAGKQGAVFTGHRESVMLDEETSVGSWGRCVYNDMYVLTTVELHGHEWL